MLEECLRWLEPRDRKFDLTAKLHPGLDMSIDRSKATGELIREDFDRYGPASLRDAMWWSGLSRLAIITAMNESARRFVMVHTPWCQPPLYMYDDRYDQFNDVVSDPRVPTLNFLAHEDVALKAYFETRGRYLGKLPPRRAFNQIGEVLPTIMHDGLVIGTWSWDARQTAVAYSIVHGYGSPGLGNRPSVKQMHFPRHFAFAGYKRRATWSNYSVATS